MSMAIGIKVFELRLHTEFGTSLYAYTGLDDLKSVASSLAQQPCVLGLRAGT